MRIDGVEYGDSTNAAPQVPNVSAHPNDGGSVVSEPHGEQSSATRLKVETPAVAALDKYIQSDEFAFGMDPSKPDVSAYTLMRDLATKLERELSELRSQAEEVKRQREIVAKEWGVTVDSVR